MTTSTHKLTGKVPVVGVDGVSRFNGTVELDETADIPYLVTIGAIEAPKAAKPKADDAPKE